MGSASVYDPEMPVVGVLSSLPETSDAGIVACLEQLLGEVRFRTESEPFTWTDYYVAEMGPAIRRFYLAFGRLADPSSLAGLKTATNAIEESYSDGGKRRVNLDPGFLAPGRFVLATTKDRAHRIVLSGGIHAELTLIYQFGEYRPLPWTYPDWGSPESRGMLSLWRKCLLERLRELRRS